MVTGNAEAGFSNELRVFDALVGRVMGLEPGTWYDFVVFSIDAKGRESEKGSSLLSVMTGQFKLLILFEQQTYCK